MISLKEISKVYHAGKPNEVRALEGINFEVGAAEFIVVVGSNGSGKSTLLNLIAGSVLPTTGEIEFDGSAVKNLPVHKRSKWVARVFQNPLHGTAPDLTILENFRLASLRTSAKTLKIGLNAEFTRLVRERIATLGLGLEDKLDQSVGSLSGGQRQALSLIMTVMDDTKILLLDEPTAALDPKSAGIVLSTANKLIADYKLTAVMVTHNMKEAISMGTRIIQLHQGSILRDIDKSTRSISHSDLYEWFI